MQRRRRVARQPVAASEPILRAELFSAREMDAHGEVLATQHVLSAHRAPERLLSRLADNEAMLIQSCERLTSVNRLGQAITPAAEWLLDNLYLIEEQIRIARQDLPRGYSRALPQLGSGASAGLPRVYDIALETISHGDGRVDAVNLERFVQAYQLVTPLQLGELWAVPIMLRLALVENLRRVAAKVMADRRGRSLAAQWGDAMMVLAQDDPKNVVLVVADMARSDPEMSSAFVAELARRLQGQGPALVLPLNWIEQRLAETGQSIEHLVQLESQQQASHQVTIANSIGSLRLLAMIDWREFVERASVVEAELRRDPAGVYPLMDFATRDRYRHVVEQLARGPHGSESEIEIARTAVALCGRAEGTSGGMRRHVGFFLVDKGRAELEVTLSLRTSLPHRTRRAFDRAPVAIFLALVLGLTAALARPTITLAGVGLPPTWIWALASIAAVLVASQLALNVWNLLATLVVSPRALPRMDYAFGIPASARTLVVIPSLVADVHDLEALVEALEVRFLANRDDHLHFALLTDFTDASAQTLPGDAALLELARLRIEALNRQYLTGPADRFFLLHRKRTWSPTSQCWMGHERKRGKLGDVNGVLRGGPTDAFVLIAGKLAELPRVRYVITLDTDTQLPRESAHVLVGTMDHLLNRPVLDAQRGRVVSGHGILQPRVGISLPNIARSRYARLHGSDAGIDPYTRNVSDVYQDLFDEGSFIGKGIYDLDVFEASLADRLPPERILSHDLIEGCFARAGLVSDVELYEEYPARYVDDARRRHRWIRGDWQLLPWLLPWAPTASRGWRSNPLSVLSRWKILDNLRRSLVPPALLAMLLVGWLALVPFGAWTAVAMAMLLLPAALSSLLDLVRKQPGVGVRQHLHVAMGNIGQHATRAALAVAMLPHEAAYSLDAIGRTLWRMVVSKRGLLEWQPSEDVARRGNHGAWALWRRMAAGPVVAVGTLVFVTLDRPLALLMAAPFLAAWFISPALARWISLPQRPPSVAPTMEQHAYLRAVARKTWAFFDVHVGPDDHWLPPDNVQLDPAPAVAHRTSPTNMGLALLANLAARDFGYIDVSRLLERTAQGLATMATLERHRGHFYNWYDTLALQPLRPLYVSSVDSGNLAGHLLALRMGLLELLDRPIFDGACVDGLRDTLLLLKGAVNGDTAQIDALLQGLSSARPDTGSHLLNFLQAQHDGAEVLAAAHAGDGDAAFWAKQWLDQCAGLLGEARWSQLDRVPDDTRNSAGAATLRELSRAAAEPIRARALERIARIEQLAAQAGEMAVMDFQFLYEGTRRLLSIGYDVEQRRLDSSYYDLLASEARLASYVAIAQGQLPQEHWFSMGRLLTTTGGSPVLLSWTGSMFEYLMPMLVMPSFEGTLLDQTCRAAVERQLQYAAQLGRPWGVSESGYNTMDVHLTYQYRAFGVPGLGLKRGLADDIVMAPYASALAAMVMPAQAATNLQRLSGMGMEARLGFYEAIDFTPARLPLGQDAALVKSHMVHHQGMSLLALAHTLLDKPMQRRFMADAQLRATALLLQERVPRTAAEYLHVTGFPESEGTTSSAEPRLRLFTDPDRSRPAVQLLSNGRYHVMVSSAGGGYSRHRDLAVTRWREDITRDHWGMHGYVRDVASGDTWSTAYQPTLARTDRFEVIFSESRAEFRVRRNEVETHTQIVVSPEDDIELRRVRVTNLGRTQRVIELTSYGEVVLAPPVADLLHPAFSKLFVQTEVVHQLQAILCTRRPRSHDEATPWMCHLLAVHDAHVHEVSYETDRARFIGRGRDASRPRALDGDVTALSGSDGSVLDPIVAIRCRIVLEPEQSATLDFVTGVADTREGCIGLIGKYRDRHLADRVFDLAWTHAQVLLRQLNATLAQAQLYEHMATSIIYPNATLRADPAIIAGNRRGQSGLWGQAISGDLPIVLLQIADPSRIELARQLVQAHAYWRLKGLAVDLVIWNEDHAGYRQELQDQIMGLITSGSEASLLDRPGGIFVRGTQQLSPEDRQVTMASARIIVNDARGSLAEQIDRQVAGSRPSADAAIRPSRLSNVLALGLEATAPPAPVDLQQANPFGGFSADGREYVVVLDEDKPTPAPWCNVIANDQFGTVVSESGSAYTWAENAHEMRLTPWGNDPVADLCGEAMYLRDDDIDHVWSPMPLPRRGEGRYITRHGAGYSVFEHVERGIRSELWTYVATDAAIKFMVLKLHNQSTRARRLSATGYVEWVLGDVREKTAMQVVTSTDPASGAIFARNAYNTEFPGRVAFFDVEDPKRRIGGDRTEFLGRNGSLAAPAALGRPQWSSRVGAGLDPCAAIQLDIVLEPGEKREVVFRMGLGRDEAAASALVHRFRRNGAAADELLRVHAQWDALLGAVQVRTPEVGVDLLANRWLMYQAIACRLWARSGYYQSGGAMGYRDQLQDAMAMLHAAPSLLRAQLLLCAAHQFPEGDVQHWWHPPLDRGVRTQCSDDYLWLPLATARYVLATGDVAVLDEPVGYIEGRALMPGEESYYDLPQPSTLREPLYRHCVRAIEHGLARGVHGLPLIGSGDWNDGMNRVGEKGLGESVWLGFFAGFVMKEFARVAQRRGDHAFADACASHVASLREAVEREAWDGAWYRRAWFDDGTALGSSANEECRIDSIAQSWSVLSGMGDGERRQQAMASLDEHLVRTDAGLIQLLDPPFDRTPMDPGYIRGYVPGVRENGGQYTHAAIWAVMAFAELGDAERAWELLRMIQPGSHAGDAAAVDVYKVEPYVVTADIYAVPPHVGRGGWSWYTGSAGWMYRLVVESLLGVHLVDGALEFRPVVPASWPGYEVTYRHHDAIYHVALRKASPGEAPSVVRDGLKQPDGRIVLGDPAGTYRVEVVYEGTPRMRP
jgi:cyclic beta-1,2-glucan glucanotransferase